MRIFGTRGLSMIVLVVVVLAGWALAAPPSFDYEKAKQLSPEKRREYDVIFANEMAIWTSNSNRYIDEYLDTHPEEQARLAGFQYKRRHEELSAMAADGYLPAYAALRLFDIRKGREMKDSVALKLLMDAADKGDVSAMCGMNELPFISTQLEDVPEFSEAQARALTKGANLGHGGCLANRGVRRALRFSKGSDGITPAIFLADVDGSLPDLFESARQGYYRAHRTLYRTRWMQLEKKDFQLSGPLELERVLCWGRLAQQHANSTFFDADIRELTGYVARGLPREQVEQLPRGLWPKVSPKYLPLIDRYSPYKVPITRRVATAEHCIEFEFQFAQGAHQ